MTVNQRMFGYTSRFVRRRTNGEMQSPCVLRHTGFMALSLTRLRATAINVWLCVYRDRSLGP